MKEPEAFRHVANRSKSMAGVLPMTVTVTVGRAVMTAEAEMGGANTRGAGREDSYLSMKCKAKSTEGSKHGGRLEGMGM